MPNLVGIWSHELSAEGIQTIVTKQLKRVRVPRGVYSDYVVTFPGFGMALQDHNLLENGSQPIYTSERKAALLLDGEINNADELRRQFSADLGDEVLSSAALATELILRKGPAVACHFNGFFCVLFYESDTRRLTIISDRYGARPLFYVQRPNAVLFGSELKALTVADPMRRQIDELGLFELFCYGSHFQNRTWMEGYLKLPPASVLTIDPKGIEITRYWNYGYDERARKLDQNTYASVFGILLDRAVERRMGGTKRIGIFLSGGYDSRSVAASIRKHHRPLPAFTFGLSESRDVRFGKMLADRLGFDHCVIDSSNPYLLKNCRAVVWRTEGMLPFSNATSIDFHDILKEKIDIILTGFLGEFGGSHTWPKLLLAQSRRNTIEAIYDRFLGHKLQAARRIFQSAFFNRISDAVRESFYKSFDSATNDHPMNVADTWNFLNLQPRGTFHAPAVDRHRFEMRAPHTDNDLLDFLLTIPPSARLEQRVYKKMIAFSFPAIRSVPCTNSARPIDPNFAREYSKMVARFVAGRTANLFRKLVSSAQPLGREFHNLGDNFRAEPDLMEHVLKPLLRASILPESMFNYSAIDEIIHQHYARKANHEQVLALLVSIGLALKFFLYDDLSEAPQELFVPTT